LFSQENRPLFPSDIIGTYRLDRIENPWFSEEVREEVNREIMSRFDIFVIGEDYYVLDDFRVEVVFSTRAIEEYGLITMDPPKASHITSEERRLFLDIPRLFGNVIVNNKSPLVIEVLDYDTVVIKSENSYMLYRRVE
jgi:hypothetical protein